MTATRPPRCFVGGFAYGDALLPTRVHVSRVGLVTVEVPDGLAKVIELREGDDGRTWLRELPRLVEMACERWHCVIDGEPTHGQVALVVPVQHAAGPAVLKMSFPHPGNLGEAGALRTFGGHGAVRLLEVDDTGLVLVLERALPETLSDQVKTGACSVEAAIDIAGELARRLAIHPLTDVLPLADTISGWENQLNAQIAAHPDALPGRVLNQARDTIRQLAADPTATMLHGDLHYGNILRSQREPWLTIDPKGWFGTAAFDAFTVAVGGREQLRLDAGLYAGFARRVRRFATAAHVDPDVALACCQARAVSSYLYQLTIPRVWFDAKLLEVIALSGDRR